MSDHDTFVVTSNQPCASIAPGSAVKYPALTYAYDLLLALLGDQSETVGPEPVASDEKEQFRAFTKYHRKRRDCPFPPEPDWA